MSIHLDKDLKDLHRSVVQMCTMVEEMVHASVEMLSNPSFENSELLARKDDLVDEYDVRIEDDCLKILALHQPVADVLRRITAVMRISAELERVADLSVHIAERACGLMAFPAVAVPDKMREMAQIAVSMLHRSIDSYVNLDAKMAREVNLQDDTVDELNHEIITGITHRMQQQPDQIEPLLQLFSASRHIERVADHASNICEDIIYMVEGEIVRHRAKFTELAPGN